MLLKRHYKKPEGWEPIRNTRDASGKLLVEALAEGDCLNPPPLSHVEMKHTGTSPEQNFSRELIEHGMREGWVQFERGELLLKVLPETLRYTVKRTPGRWCLHCGVALLEDTDGAKSREHVKAFHDGVPSPDANNPAGYVKTHAYECALNTAQHEKFKKKDKRNG